jgi:hypothetical protein
MQLFKRRPSASMVVALIALFAACGGVGWAATNLPANSVGTAQLKGGAVTNGKLANGSVSNFKLAFNSVGTHKMMDGAIGKGQINSNQVQARVSGTCTSGAIGSINSAGKVQCVSAPGQEFGTSTTTAVPVPSGTAQTSITSQTLPGGSSYIVFANPYVQITGGGPTQGVEVDCTLSVGPTVAAKQTRSYAVELGSQDQASSIPLVVTAPSNPTAITATVTCLKTNSGATAPQVTVSTAINALPTAGNTTGAATG